MDVFYQAVWYLAAFLLTHLFSTANRSIQLATGGSTYFPLILLHSFFDPLQGEAVHYEIGMERLATTNKPIDKAYWFLLSSSSLSVF